jgi:hypothetical protein
VAELLIGRDWELNAVRAFLAGSRDGPAVVLLEGEAGMEDDGMGGGPRD